MMTPVALSLGSNLGDRLAHLRFGVHALAGRGLLKRVRCSPVMETAAYLKPNAPDEWDRPFLNLVVDGQSTLNPQEFLRAVQSIEVEAGRGPHETWAPRPLDIDILAWGEAQIEAPGLSIPHREIANRAFVLDPWAALHPSRRLAGLNATVLELRRRNQLQQPLLMAIVNVTPDSFSDGGKAFLEADLQARLKDILDLRPAIIDIGGQSTRPGAEIVGLDEEWTRVQRALLALEPWRREPIRPWVSLDTFRPEIARRALEWGVEIINDVTGLTDPEMLRLARESQAQFVFMHHLGVPVDPRVHLPRECDPVAALHSWANTRVQHFVAQGIDPDRLIFDPGIGFGKLPRQSEELIKRAAEFKDLGVRVLFGHSRKSYQKQIVPEPHTGVSADRDAVTLYHSLHLAQAGVEMLRVHDLRAHRSAWLARDHLAFCGINLERSALRESDNESR